MGLVTIGEFAARTRLSAKALRLYAELGLVVPAEVDTHNGYRRYTEDQVEPARLVGLLRQLDMPLAVIASVVGLPGPAAADAVATWWTEVEATTAGRRALVSYLRARLTGEDLTMYDIHLRTLPERRLLRINRHVHLAGVDAFFADAFTRLRALAPGLPGIAGIPFVVFYGDVSADSDGPIELCRPIAADTVVDGTGDIQLTVEPEHEEAYVRLTMKEMGWPAMMPAADALNRWVAERERQAGGPVRQVLIADQRTAAADTPACDLSIPLRD
ncbi:MAG TPA: MerR family transcriptional regulator [Pseudonocardiaceae bacterium]|jgi:DNA-binding transcriptional MerR regulator|nr:MerR family transcriptional regulator [Pseudonocardiaceae bacterium]